MELTSEQVHWIVGAVITAFAALLLWLETRPASVPWARFVIPSLLLSAGLMLVFDPLLHGAAAPENYGAETAQHIGMGVVLLAIGAIELARAMGKLSAPGWALVLPAVLVGIGLLFVMHAQHDADVPMLLLIAQHRIVGVTLWLIAGALAVAELSTRLRPAFRVAALTLMLLFGVEFLLYTEGNLLFGSVPTHGAGHDGH